MLCGSPLDRSLDMVLDGLESGLGAISLVVSACTVSFTTWWVFLTTCFMSWV